MSEEIKETVEDFDHPFKDEQYNMWLQNLAKNLGKTTKQLFNELKDDESTIGIPIVNQLYAKAREQGLIGGIRKVIIMTDEGPIEVGVELLDTAIIKCGTTVRVKNAIGVVYGISAPRTKQTYKGLELAKITATDEETKILPPIRGLKPEKMTLVKDKCTKAGKKGYEEIVSGTITSVEQPSEKFSSYRMRVSDVTFKGAFGVILDNDAIERFGLDEILEKPETDENGEKEYDLKPLENRMAKVYGWWNVQKGKTGGREFVNGYPYYVWCEGMPKD